MLAGTRPDNRKSEITTFHGMFKLRLLGGSALEDDTGVSVPAASRRHPLALLALLACAPAQALNRSKLAGLLWPESPEKTARNRLNTCVHRVRSELGRQALISTGDELRLNDDVVESDVTRFQKALRAGRHRAAATVYGGPFLDGFRLEGSPEFERLVDRERERFRRGYREALEALAETAEREGDPGAAAGWWRERANEDPYDSRVTGRLMKTLVAAGNRPEALRAGSEHARRMKEDLGVAPDATIAELADRIRSSAGDLGATPATEDERSTIAVLPFETLGNGDSAAFTDGIHSDILTRLSSIAGLGVISRSSVLEFRDSKEPLPDIARKLGVTWILQGDVQEAGDQVRVSARLVNAHRDRQVWAKAYRRELTAENLFRIQGEITRRIARALEARLTPGEEQAITRAPTESLDAHRLYVQGRGQLDQRTEEAARRALDYFREALELDPGFALAWAGLADVLSIFDYYNYGLPDTARDFLDAARRGVALGPELGETHASLGIHHALRQEAPAALRELSRAVKLRPSYSEAFAWLGWMYLIVGRPNDALAPGRQAAELSPLAPAARAFLAEIYLANEDADAALGEARRAREIQPDYGLAHFLEGLILYHMNRYKGAQSALRQALALVEAHGTPSRSEIRALLALTHAATDEPERSRQLLGQVRESGDWFSTGLIHAALGDIDAAFEHFRTVRFWNSFAVEHFRHFFPDVLGPVRGDERYRALLARVDRAWGLEEEY